MLVQVLFLAIGLVCCASGADDCEGHGKYISWTKVCTHALKYPEEGVQKFCDTTKWLCTTAELICSVWGALDVIGDSCWTCNDTSNLHELVESQGLRFDWLNVCEEHSCSYIEKVHKPLGQCCPLVCGYVNKGRHGHGHVPPPIESSGECSAHIAGITKKYHGVAIDWDKACGKQNDPICTEIPELCECSNLVCGYIDVQPKPRPMPMEEETVAVGRSESSRCPRWWYEEEDEGICWELFQDQLSWADAERKCNHLGPGYGLATVDTRQKLALANTYLIKEFGEDEKKGHVWLGGIQEKPDENGERWYWTTTNERISSSDAHLWAPRHSGGLQPDNEGGNENCLQLYKWNYAPWRWNDDKCWKQRMYMCEFYLD